MQESFFVAVFLWLSYCSRFTEKRKLRHFLFFCMKKCRALLLLLLLLLLFSSVDMGNGREVRSTTRQKQTKRRKRAIEGKFDLGAQREKERERDNLPLNNLEILLLFCLSFRRKRNRWVLLLETLACMIFCCWTLHYQWKKKYLLSHSV